MKKLKIYLDTSVISFVFADDAPEKQAITCEFFDYYLDKYNVFISDLVLAEIEQTQDDLLKSKLKNVVKKYKLEILQTNENDQQNIFNLAQKYIDNKIITEKYFDDAIHIATTTYYNFDILLSWNFKHIANIVKQIEVNKINQSENFIKELYLLNPMEVIYNEEK